MKQRKLLSLFLAAVMALSLALPAAAAESVPDSGTDLSGKLIILHTNDTHGGDVAVAEEGGSIGTAGAAQLKKDYEAAGAEVLLLSAGDAIQGAPLVNYDNGESAIRFMNAAGYDAMALGNHEFDWNIDHLREVLDTAQFPILSANIVNRSDGKPAFGDHVILTTESGLKVGIFGLTTPETATKTNPKNVADLTFLGQRDPQELYDCAAAEVKALQAENCDLIVCLSHLGVDDESVGVRSLDVAEHVEGIDLIVDGHSHSTNDFIASKNDGSNIRNGALIVSTGTKLAHVGVVTYDRETGALDFGYVTAGSYTAVDEAVNDMVNAQDALVKEALKAVVGKTEVLLNGERDPGVRTMETNLGNFACDAILWAAQQELGEDAVDAAFTNGGGIRASIPAGDISLEIMATVFPFGNTVATVDVTGAQLLEMLEANTYCLPTAIGGFPQVSGITYTVDTSVPYENGEQYPDSTYYAPANPGARVKDVTVGGAPLDLEKTYTLATNDYTAVGGDAYGVLTQTTNLYVSPVPLEDALINYATTALGGAIPAGKYAQTEGRITILLPYPADVDTTAWYFEAVAYVLDNAIMRSGADAFDPNGLVTRGMVYDAMYSLAGRPAATQATTFTDVADTWYADAAAWAEATGLTTGTGNHQFSGDREVTRQELAKIFADYAAGEKILPAAPADLSTFADHDSVADWAREGMQAAVALGIISGSSNNLNPTGTAMRMELAQILLNYSKMEPAETPEPAPAYTETPVQIQVPEQDGVPAHTIDGVLTLPAGEGTFPAVVMLHGTGSNKDEAGNGYAMAAPRMAEAGVASLRIDFMGTAADKAAEYVHYSYTSANIDAKAAAAYLADLQAVNADQIAVMGWSQGGTNALLAAAAYPETFSAVVTWAGALDLTGLFGETSFADARAIAEAEGAFTMTLDWRTPSDLPVGSKWFDDVDNTDVLAKVAGITAPVLAIHGEADDTVLPASAGQIAGAAANGSTHMIPNCDHTFNVFTGDFTALYDAVDATSAFILECFAQAEADKAA